MANNIVNIESLDMEGRGIAHHVNEDGSRGKVIFVEGALPGEQVTCLVYRNKSHWEAATVVEVLRASTLRVDPKCPHFDMSALH